MSHRRCPFCHKFIAIDEFNAHFSQHTARRTDGQQIDYVTLPSEERASYSLDEVPQVYEHMSCGSCTQMPEEIVRSYLVNPYLYLADNTYCSGCFKHVPLRECFWVETRESVQAYMNRLRAERPEFRPNFFERLLVFVFHQKWL